MKKKQNNLNLSGNEAKKITKSIFVFVEKIKYDNDDHRSNGLVVSTAPSNERVKDR